MHAFWGLFVLVVLITFGGAEAQIQVPKPKFKLQNTFSHDDFTWSKAQGTGVIAGQASLVAQGGFIQYPEDKPVVLVPRNAYTDEIVAASRMPGFFDKFSDVEKVPEYFQYRRVQQPDEKGQFRFENLPAGEWYIASTVIWFTRDQYGVVHVNGGNVWGQITLGDGEIRDDLHLNTTSEIIK